MMMIGGPIHLIHFLNGLLVKEDWVTSLCIVLDMRLLLWMVQMAFMIVCVTWFVVEYMPFLRQVHHLTVGKA